MTHAPAHGAWQDPGTSTGHPDQPACRVVPAVLHSPFRPVGYVLVDGYLLYAAVWRDGAQPPPATGGLVAVTVPFGRPGAEALPLSAYPLPPGPLRPAMRPPHPGAFDITPPAGPAPENQQEHEPLGAN